MIQGIVFRKVTYKKNVAREQITQTGLHISNRMPTSDSTGEKLTVFRSNMELLNDYLITRVDHGAYDELQFLQQAF